MRKYVSPAEHARLERLSEDWRITLTIEDDGSFVIDSPDGVSDRELVGAIEATKHAILNNWLDDEEEAL